MYRFLCCRSGVLSRHYPWSLLAQRGAARSVVARAGLQFGMAKGWLLQADYERWRSLGVPGKNVCGTILSGVSVGA
jgi:hypothetical protein